MVLDISSIEEQNLAEVYRFADFGRLAAGLFHDLATPLNVVLLNLEELQTTCIGIEDKKATELRTAVDRAFNGTQRMVRFLQLAREHAERKTVLSEFSITHEIEEAISLFGQNEVSKKIKIYFKNQKNIRYFGNQTQLFQVIMNLLSNAIGAYSADELDKKIEISLNEEPKEIQISVQDWGCGISKKDQPFIFEALFSTKGNKGSGIGLFVSREIIQKHFRGKLKFTSVPGRGSTFTIHLPRRASLRVSE